MSKRSRTEALGHGLDWPGLNTRALMAAHALVLPGQSWCLFSYWRCTMTPEESWKQHSMLVEGLTRPCTSGEPMRVHTMMAHYLVDDVQRTRFEPWMFATGSVRLGLVAWLCSRFRRPLAFWGEGTSLFALTPDADCKRSPWGAAARPLGTFRSGAIAHAVVESSLEAATFVGFDVPASTYVDALARTAFVGAAR